VEQEKKDRVVVVTSSPRADTGINDNSLSLPSLYSKWQSWGFTYISLQRGGSGANSNDSTKSFAFFTDSCSFEFTEWLKLEPRRR